MASQRRHSSSVSRQQATTLVWQSRLSLLVIIAAVTPSLVVRSDVCIAELRCASGQRWQHQPEPTWPVKAPVTCCWATDGLSWCLSRDVVESQLLGRGVRRGNSTQNHALSGCARLIRLVSRCLLSATTRDANTAAQGPMSQLRPGGHKRFDGKSTYKPGLRRHAFFTKLHQQLSSSRKTRFGPWGCRVWTVGNLLPGSLELQSRLRQQCVASKRRLAASFAGALQHVDRRSQLLMTPLISGDTLGLLGWQGIRCCKQLFAF